MVESLCKRGQQFPKTLIMQLWDHPASCPAGHLSERNGNCMLPYGTLGNDYILEMKNSLVVLPGIRDRRGVGGEGGGFMKELGGVLKRAVGGILPVMELFSVCIVVVGTQTYMGFTQ